MTLMNVEATVAEASACQCGLKENLPPNMVYRNQGRVNSRECILSDDDPPKPFRHGLLPWLRHKAKNTFKRKILLKRLPVLGWLPKYNMPNALGDLVAGITVGLTVIPQSLAYSNVAGLPAQFGLYGSFLGCFLYIIFGSCKDVPLGPTAIVSLLTYQTTGALGYNHHYAVLLAFLSGCVEVLMGVLGLGFVIDFISGPVSSGFTSAAALIIVTSQIKDIFGIQAQGNTFIEQWKSLIHNFPHSSLPDVLLGVSCIIVLLLMRLLTKVRVGPNDPEAQTKSQRIINKTLWLIGTSRNAILVIVSGIVGWKFYSDNTPFKLIGEIPPGMPSMQAPKFGFTEGNTTVTFGEMIENLGSGIIVVPLVSLLENIAICKAFANGKAVDASQELIAIGIANIGNSLVQGFPGSGSLSRSAVLNSSGSRTPLNGLYTGFLVIMALLFCTPLFFFIPKAALAAIIIAAVIFMVEVHVVIPMWKTKKSDLIPGIGTFIGCLVLQLEIGILVGIGINILFILYHAARPKIAVESATSRGGVEYLILTPDRSLIFPSVDYVRNLVTKRSMKQAHPVVIDCTHIYGADFTAAKVIECLTQDFSQRRQPLFFFNLKPSVIAVFQGLQPKDFVCYHDEDQIDDLIRGYQKTHQDEIAVITTG